MCVLLGKFWGVHSCGGTRLTLSIVTDHSLSYTARQNRSPVPELAILTSLDRQITLGTPISVFCGQRLKAGHHAHIDFTRVLNSGLHACTASILPMKPSAQLLYPFKTGVVQVTGNCDGDLKACI